ncbi:MAG: SH3 domain-containing protein, partial [Chloroflexi bacterium]|nr:SH3 domain-containing protein [Chloroflexota bacterium]
LGRNSNSSWVKVQVNTATAGWVNATLVDPSVAIDTLTVLDAPTLSSAATVATGALNVRSGPGVTYSVLTVASYGQSVGLLGRNNNSSWAKVLLTNGTEGWVNASFLTPNVEISSLAVVDAPAEPEPPLPVAPGAQLSLRSGPGLSYTVVGSVFQGQEVQAIGRNSASTWVKVRIVETGLEGWISLAYVQLSVDLATLPIMDGSSTTATATPTATTPTATTTPTTTAAAAVINTGALNVRSGPGAGYGIVAVANHGQTVSLLGRISNSSWVKIRTSTSVEGWVNATYITANVDIATLPVLDAPTLSATAVINTGALNVRSGPGIEYTATAVVYQYESVGLIARNSNSSWVKIRTTNDHIGWVNALYIQTTTTINSLPIATE